jgi:hypothetical protein
MPPNPLLSLLDDVVDQRWFQCRSGSRVLMIKNCEILQQKANHFFSTKISIFFIPAPLCAPLYPVAHALVYHEVCP